LLLPFSLFYIVRVVFSLDRTGIPAQINGVAALRHGYSIKFTIYSVWYLFCFYLVVFIEELFIAAGAHVLPNQLWNLMTILAHSS